MESEDRSLNGHALIKGMHIAIAVICTVVSLFPTASDCFRPQLGQLDNGDTCPGWHVFLRL